MNFVLFGVSLAILRDGYRSFFYSNDHEPIHVHVRRGGGEAVLDVSSEIAVRESLGMKAKELRRAVDLATEHRENGLEFSFPIDGNPRLEGASAESLSAIELSPLGLHWPELDEDLSIRGLLSGDFGQRPGRAA